MIRVGDLKASAWARAGDHLRRRGAHFDARFDGKVPETELELRSLPASVSRLAQAVLTFAFGRRAVLLDVTTSASSSDTSAGRTRADGRSGSTSTAGGHAGSRRRVQPALLDHGALVCRGDRRDATSARSRSAVPPVAVFPEQPATAEPDAIGRCRVAPP